MISADFLIEHASLVATCAGPAPRRGAAQREITAIADGTIAAKDGLIVYVGPSSGVAGRIEAALGAARVDASGCAVVPGFVDPHTHVVFAGDRRAELRDRLAGATYAQIASSGGGILRTVAATREASPEDLVAAALPRLDEMLANGTTTCEVKSGYGLTVPDETRSMKIAFEVTPETTFLGAHVVPTEYAGRPDDYVSLVCGPMLTAVEPYAKWVDVFCEQGAFDADQCRATRLLCILGEPVAEAFDVVDVFFGDRHGNS